MDRTTIFLNASALVASLAALVVSSLLALRQVGIMRRSNHLPVILEHFRELRASDFSQVEIGLWDHLGDHDPSLGFRNLPEPIRTDAYRISLFYQDLGYLIDFGDVDQNLILDALGYRISETWQAVRAHVVGERVIRGGRPFLDRLELMAAASHHTPTGPAPDEWFQPASADPDSH
jgi:hypothetical protein